MLLFVASVFIWLEEDGGPSVTYPNIIASLIICLVSSRSWSSWWKPGKILEWTSLRSIVYILRNQFAISKTTHWLNTGKTELNMDETFHPKHQDLQRNKFKVFQHHLFRKVIFRIKFLACNSAQRIKVEFTEIAFLVINSQSWDM